MSPDREIIWVVTNTNSIKQAEKIGRTALKARLCACFSIFPKIKSVYFWPPKTQKLETSKGPLLVMDSLPKHYLKIVKLIRSLHSDSLPLIGQIEVEEVEKKFYNWLSAELKV